MQKPEVLKVLKAIHAGWPMFEVDEDALDFWWARLKDEDYATTMAAIGNLADDPNQKFPPHPGAIKGHGKPTS